MAPSVEADSRTSRSPTNPLAPNRRLLMNESRHEHFETASGVRWTLHRRTRVTSTMTEILTLLPPLETGWQRTALVAEVQVDGRGRRGHAWQSPRGGLWMSFAMPASQPDPFLGLLVAAAAREAIERLLPPQLTVHTPLAIKWPNDLIVGERKWGGVVLEFKSGRADRPSVLIGGVGLNLDVTFDEGDRPPNATSIREACGTSPDVAAALLEFASQLDAHLERDPTIGRDAMVTELSRHVTTLGRSIRWSEGDVERQGRALALETNGALLVQDADGRERSLHSGEVRHVAPLAPPSKRAERGTP